MYTLFIHTFDFVSGGMLSALNWIFYPLYFINDYDNGVLAERVPLLVDIGCPRGHS